MESAGKSKIFVAAADSMTGLQISRDLLLGDRKSYVEQVVVGVHNKEDEKAQKLQKMGAHLVELGRDQVNGDEAKRAMKNSDVVIIVADPNWALHEDLSRFCKCMETLILSAAESVKAVVFVSAMGCDESNVSNLEHFKKLEDILKKKTFSKGWTIVRTNIYQEHFLWFAKQIVQENSISLPIEENKKWAPLSIRDVGCSVALIATSGKGQSEPIKSEHHNKIYELTGPQSHSCHEMVESLTRVLGNPKQPIKWNKVDRSKVEEYLKRQESEGLTRAQILVLLDYYKLIEEGKLSKHTEDLKKIAHTEGIKIEEFFRENANRFKSI